MTIEESKGSNELESKENEESEENKLNKTSNQESETPSEKSKNENSPIWESDKDRILNDLKQTGKDFWLLWVHLMAPIVNYFKDKYETISPSKRQKIDKMLKVFKEWWNKWWSWFKKLTAGIWWVFVTPKSKEEVNENNDTKDQDNKEPIDNKENENTNNDTNKNSDSDNTNLNDQVSNETENKENTTEKENKSTKKSKTNDVENENDWDIINKRLKKYRPNKPKETTKK